MFYNAVVINPRYKPLIIGAVTVFLAWILVAVGYRIADAAKVTTEKVTQALRTTDLNAMDPASRARRLRELALKFNALDHENRHKARRDPAWEALWASMTEVEKGDFIERTMPTGFKQMINAFEQLTEDKRRSAITNTLARLQRMRDGELPAIEDTNRPPPLSEELQKKVITTGLKAFYAESTAQTKAEMAPVLEEMQVLMESGRLFRR